MASEESKALHNVGEAVRHAAHGSSAAHDAMVETASDARKNDLSGVAPRVAKAFCTEQLHIDPEWCRVIKECEKSVMRQASRDSSTHELITACSNWFSAAYMLQQARLAREEAWKAEFTGRKGDLHKIFDQIDVDGDGTINLAELQGFFAEFGGAGGLVLTYLPTYVLTLPNPCLPYLGFFGFGDASAGDKGKELAAAEARRNAEADGEPTPPPPESDEAAAHTAEVAAGMLAQDMPSWLEEEQGAGTLGPEALFARLDRDQSGEVQRYVT
jgi:hypothetical protein